MPEAKATGGLSEKDVATALKRTRELLKASNLDRRVLFEAGHKPFSRLLHPQIREWFLKNLDRRKPREDGFNTRYWLTSFAPETAEPVTDVIKVHGRTKLSPFKSRGRTGVRIKVNYLFVYAVQRPGQPHTAMRVVAHNVGEIEVHRENGELVIWVRNWNSEGTAGARCDVGDGFVHPSYEDSPRTGRWPRRPAPRSTRTTWRTRPGRRAAASRPERENRAKYEFFRRVLRVLRLA
nr:hypothetical protein GCM10020093_111790 [Planobispora longispora]